MNKFLFLLAVLALESLAVDLRSRSSGTEDKEEVVCDDLLKESCTFVKTKGKCIWDHKHSRCVDKGNCGFFHTEEVCKQSLDCYWYASEGCTRDECKKDKEEDCGGKCTWDNGYCLEK